MTTSTSSALFFIPPGPATAADLRAAAAGCQGCGLYRDATQTVFGSGPGPAEIMLLGEQPGDVEDRRGEPFVGPAGRVLDRALEELELDRGRLYLTNVVKHFKHTLDGSGKRRIHQTPNRAEVIACLPWLTAELDQVRPRLVVALGATAAKAVMGTAFRVTRDRGTLLSWPPSGPPAPDPPPALLATIHPSAVLRADDQEAAYRGMLDDLRVAVTALRE